MSTQNPTPRQQLIEQTAAKIVTLYTRQEARKLLPSEIWVETYKTANRGTSQMARYMKRISENPTTVGKMVTAVFKRALEKYNDAEIQAALKPQAETRIDREMLVETIGDTRHIYLSATPVQSWDTHLTIAHGTHISVNGNITLENLEAFNKALDLAKQFLLYTAQHPK